MNLYGELEYKREFRRRLLELLVRKYENSASFAKGEVARQKPQISFTSGPFQADYEDEMDFRKKEWIHDVVTELAAQGIVSVKWEKFQEGRKLAKVYLEPERLELAYEQAGITPRDLKMERLSLILGPLADHPWEWVARWAREMIQALEERKTAGLDLEDPEGYERLVMVLKELPKLEDDIPKRVLSQRLFHDTKMFERVVERRLVHLIQSRSGIECDSDAEALESVGISDQPRGVWVAGTLTCSVGGEALAVDRFPGGIGLSRETVRRLTVDAIRGERIVLIENLTSWHQWVKARHGENELVVYTGGFPNRSVQLLLFKIASCLYGDARESLEGGAGGDMPVYHWGDLDAGGIHIFEFIRERYFPDLLPLGMDEGSYLRYVDTGLPFSRAYARRLADMLESGKFTRWRGLLELMLEYGKRIEQEGMAIPADGLK